MAKAKAKGLAALDKIAGAKSTTTRKSVMPVCTVSDAMNRAMADWAAAKSDLENAKARKLNAEVMMTDEAQSLRLEGCKSSGKLHASVKLSGNTSTLTFTQKSQCLKMAAECEGKLRSVVGSDVIFDRYFKIRGDFKIDADALAALPNANEVAAALVEALGDNSHILTRETVIVPTESYYHDKVFDKKTVRIAEQLEEESLAVPHKASFR